ncbi:hypothetical protein KO507_10710 [Gilvimarinus agarilyticus]|uniref:hypothetical protein n=1 Tax=Gilvimarinus sp. 2_MG-2023 TaxID=3062666 RepID=UPI001C08D2C1|nr:hypothetical protein [Gilvimarinus sp. 2_MG-2023]MBU2886233.1 hypothetical protein [Gilvimarinus agarilyticus]MDO6570921.1 hypothetical protein [Gilvimarinus sp. 2_MG-2023]
MGVVNLLRPALLALAAITASAQAQLHPAAQDLSYGESLYHYYQGDLPQALIALDLAQSRGGIKGHQHYPELMRGGMLLAYGMTEQAQQAFNTHLNQGEPGRLRDTAHLYLARLHYQAGRLDQAQLNLDALQGSLSPGLAEEAANLRISLLIAGRGAPSLNDAEPILEPLAEHSHLALLNLGNSAARQNDPIRAQSYYQALLAAAPPTDPERGDEYLALRDKALTALGYSYLQQKDFASAKAAFRRVRLETAFANRALLGYGWSAASYHDYVLALKPWQALRQRSLLDPAVQESLLAVPWAYEQMGSTGAALIAYGESETLLTEMLADIDTHLAQLNAQALLDYLTGERRPQALHPSQAKSGQNWLSLPDSSVITSPLTYLDTLLRDDAQQQQAQLLRDLVDLQHRHRQWQQKLDVYRELVQQKRLRRAERADQLSRSGLLQQSDELQTVSDRLSEQLRQIEVQHNAMALADTQTRALHARQQSAQRALQALEGKKPLPYQAQAKLNFFAGVLQWRAAQQLPANRWEVQKRLNQINASLASSLAASERIEQLLAQEQDLQAQLQRLNRARERNQQLLAAQAQAINEQAAALSAALRGHLGEHRARLNDYLAQTRLSIARLMDDAYRNRPPLSASPVSDIAPEPESMSEPERVPEEAPQ